jgi:thymidylate synthase ThyX
VSAPNDPSEFHRWVDTTRDISPFHEAQRAPRRVYQLAKDGRTLTPEVVAVALAKSSRSPLPFDVNAGLVTEEGASKFHDKWVLGYGHNSVAEGATGHVCVEKVSMLCAKAIEDGRLGSYIEASTRYQEWSRHNFAVPPELDAPVLATLRRDYVRHCYKLFAQYEMVLAKVLMALEAATPRPAHMTGEAFLKNLHAKGCDVARGMLPASATTNLGYVSNARTFEHNVSKLLSHELGEMRQVGAEMLPPLKEQFPTLLKYAAVKPYLTSYRERLQGLAASLVPRSRSPFFFGPHMLFIEPRPLEEAHISALANALFPFTDAPYSEIVARLARLDEVQMAAAYNALFEDRGDHDGTPRALEDHPLGFELVMDFGTWRDLQRHRMTTQFNQLLSPDLGYHTPGEILDMGLMGDWAGVEAGAAMYNVLLGELGPAVAQYAVPMAYRMRSLFKLNVRELHALVELRSRPGGHINYRRVAAEMYHEVARVNPLLVSNLRLSPIAEDDDLKRIKDLPAPSAG